MSVAGVNTGKGRGRQVIAVARTADLILMMLDAVKGDVQRSAFWFVTVFLFFASSFVLLHRTLSHVWLTT